MRIYKRINGEKITLRKNFNICITYLSIYFELFNASPIVRGSLIINGENVSGIDNEGDYLDTEFQIVFSEKIKLNEFVLEIRDDNVVGVEIQMNTLPIRSYTYK